MLWHFPIDFGLVNKTKCLDRLLEHVIIYCEIPFGFLITNVMLRNFKKSWIVFYNNMMSLKWIYFLLFPYLWPIYHIISIVDININDKAIVYDTLCCFWKWSWWWRIVSLWWCWGFTNRQEENLGNDKRTSKDKG